MATEKRLIDTNGCPCIKCDRLGKCRPGFCEAFAEWWLSPVDAVEVVHGRWIKINKYDEDSSVQCSKCLMEFDYIDGVCYLVTGSELPHYCPNCGTKMEAQYDF